MHNTQHYCWTSSENPLNTSSSVIQQRGNVIVSRSQFIDDNHGALQYHHHQQDRPPQNNRNNEDDKNGNEIPALCSGSIAESSYQNHPHNISDGFQDNCNDISSIAKHPVSTAQSTKKTDKNGDSNGNARTRRTKKTPESFTCSYCQKIFKHKSYYEYHLRTHTGERPFQCNLCEKSFFERSKLNRHLSSCHNITNHDGYDIDEDERSNNICPQCHKTFSRSSGLQAHLQTHHEGRRPFSCTKCDKKFSGLTALKNHEKSHQGAKDILCDICGKGFLLKKYLDLHLNTTHKREPRKHGCSMCRKEFHSEKDLKRHQLMHSNAKNFTCSLCQTSFKRKDNLNRHLKLTHNLAPEQLSEESENSLEISKTNRALGTQSNAANQNLASASIASSSVPPPPPVNQVSVIKSTHEVMMSITRGEKFM